MEGKRKKRKVQAENKVKDAKGGPEVGRERMAGEGRDRKSTRLNSSH